MAESFSDEEIRQRANSYDGVPPDVFDRWLEQRDAELELKIRTQIAGRIHTVELHIQYMLEEDPINARLNGALSALQQARDIAEGKNLV